VVVLSRHNDLVGFREAVDVLARDRRLSLVVNDTHVPNRDLRGHKGYAPTRAKQLFLANYGLSDFPVSEFFFYSELIPEIDHVIADWERNYRAASGHRMNLPPHRDYVLELRLFDVLVAQFRDRQLYVGDSVLGTHRFLELLNAGLGDPLRIEPLHRYAALGPEAAREGSRVSFFSYSFMTDDRYFGPVISELGSSHGTRAEHVCQRYCHALVQGSDFVPYEVYRPARSRRESDGGPAYEGVLARTRAYQRGVLESFLEREAPDVVVTRDDTLPFIAWLDELRQIRGFKVIHVPHGMDQIAREYDVDPWFADRCALGSPGLARAPDASAGKAVLTGDLLRPGGDGGKRDPALRRRFAGRRVLLLPSQGSHETRRVIDLVAPVLREAPDYLLLIKPNPFEDFIDYDLDTQQLGGGVRMSEGDDIADLLSVSEALITANSSSLVRAIEQRVPVLAFRPLLSRTILEETPGALSFFETSEEIAEQLQALERMPDEAKRAAAGEFLTRYFPVPASDAVTNLTELVVSELP
jgi:hypothetical protein